MNIETFLKLKENDQVSSVFQVNGKVVGTQNEGDNKKVLIDWEDGKQSTETVQSCVFLKEII